MACWFVVCGGGGLGSSRVGGGEGDVGGGWVGKSEKFSSLAAKQKKYPFFACFLVKKWLERGIYN